MRRILLALAAAFSAGAQLREAVTLHAGFEGGPNASFAIGDPRLYSAESYKVQGEARPGLGSPELTIARGAGKFGDALRFTKKNTRAVFYRAGKNVEFDPRNWSGTVSFWLKLDPDKDLEPGFCDPIQITDDAYNDSAIWVDFTKDDKPRHFRLGVFGDLKAWNPENLPPDKNPNFMNRLVTVRKTPFSAGEWTHVVATWSGLGSGQGSAQLYLNGQSQGEAKGISEPFTWDFARAAIRLGLNYTGLFDELVAFRRPLSGSEVRSLYSGGVPALHK